MEFDDGGRKIFYATYTAYSGRAIRSELIETSDFISFRMSPLQRNRRTQQGHGPVPAQDRRQVRHDRQAGQREPLPDLFGRSVFLGWRRRDPEAAIPVGVRADRQLRVADRARRGLAAADPRRRPGAEIFDRRGSPRQEGSRPRFLRGRASRWSGPNRRSAKDTSPMSSTHAERCGTTTRSSCPMRSPTPSPTSPRSRSPR